MNLKILIAILLYYTLTSMFFVFGGTSLTDYTNSANLSSMNVSQESETGGLFGVGVSFTRWWLFLSFGIGLPASTPSWFIILFMAWQTFFSIFVAAFIISSIWNG